MNITEVRVYKTKKESKIKAMASVTFDDCFVVSSLKVVEGNSGLFVAMPSQKVGEQFKDVCFPKTKEFREELNNAVIDKYNENATAQEESNEGFIPVDMDDELPF